MEYYEPKEKANLGKIQLDKVVHGFKYIDLEAYNKDYNDSGPCNVNVNCPDGDNWQDEKKSVALIIVNGFRNCTGYLMNNTDKIVVLYL